MSQRIDRSELIERCAAKQRELARLWQAEQHQQAGAIALELVELIAALRNADATREAITTASALVDQLGPCARTDAQAYLPALVRTIAELGRCFERLGEYVGAASAFGSAVEAQKILVVSHADTRHEGDTDALDIGALDIDARDTNALNIDARDIDALIDLLSRHAVALAQAGELEQARTRALEFVELAREHLPRALPQLGGGLVFMADLTTELGRPQEAITHLIEGFELLDAAAAQQRPGAREAAARLAPRLRSAALEAGVELPAELRARLDGAG